jgi:cyanate permease
VADKPGIPVIDTERPDSSVLQYLAAVLVGVAGYAASSIKPVLVVSYVRDLGLSVQLAGYLLAVEMTALAVGTLIATALLPYTRSHRFIVVPLVAIIVGNLGATVWGHGLVLYGWRLIAGLGNGIAIGRLAIAIGVAKRPERLSGLYAIASMVVATVATLVVPKVQELFGPSGIFGILVVPPVLALAALRWFPDHRAGGGSTVEVPTRRPSASTAVLVGLATILYYLSLGGYWPFVGQFAASSGIAHTTTLRVLAWTQVVGAVGAAIPMVVGDRWGRFWPTTILLAMQLASILMLQPEGMRVSTYAASACLFFFGWLCLFPYLMGLLSELDSSGRLNALLYGLCGFSFALGPAAAGWLIGHFPSAGAGLILVQKAAFALLLCGGGIFLLLARPKNPSVAVALAHR